MRYCDERDESGMQYKPVIPSIQLRHAESKLNNKYVKNDNTDCFYVNFTHKSEL